MSNSEAQARIKTNKGLEASGWRLVDEGNHRSNVQLENNITIKKLGDDFDAVSDALWIICCLWIIYCLMIKVFRWWY